VYNTHITSNGAPCHDRSTSAGENTKHLYSQDGYHLCLFGSYDNPREQWVSASNISENKRAQ